MGQRNWDTLSAERRKRYKGWATKNGIQDIREYYNSGGNLSGARGHGNTPEHPKDALRHPERYPAYLKRFPNAGLPFPAFTYQYGEDDEGNRTDWEPGDPITPTVDDRWSKKQRTVISYHWHAIRRYKITGKTDKLNEFSKRWVGGVNDMPRYKLETRTDVIKQYLATQKAEPYENLYKYALRLKS
jgi:hypothetical protein